MASDQLLRIARQSVLTDRLLGVTELPVNLAALQAAAAQASSQPVTSYQQARPATRTAAASSPPPASTRPQPAQAPVAKTTSSVRTGSIELPPLAEADTSSAAARSVDVRLTMLQTLDDAQVKGCTLCELSEHRTQTVFGEGNPQADLMFIGEGPGEQEDKQGRPFVGPAGQLLDKMITAMGIAREDVYIANAVKCRPPGNRPPTPDEAHTCSQYLKQQIAIVRPRIIVTLGAPATKLMLSTTAGISTIRGRWHSFDLVDDDGSSLRIPVMPTFHPSYVLRRYTPEVRKTVWDDLQLVMAYLKQS